MKEFSLMHYQYDNPRKRQCRWPGITVLCPHLKLSPKKLMQIKYDLSSKACSYSIRTDIKKHIPQWHECSFTSPSGRISYTLTIALALSETDELVFESQYLIDFRRAKHYDDPEKIMLCPHVNTAERLGRHINLRGPGCGICRISPTVKRSDGNIKYDIQFKRSFRDYNDTRDDFDDRFSDYNWLRYVLYSVCRKEVLICI
jgi:hypothetical protein